MVKKELIYDGVSIKIYATDIEDEVIVYFTDDITAYSKIKKAEIKDKGIYCNWISSMISDYLQKSGIPTYFVKRISDREQVCKKIDLIPIEIIVRNVIAGSMSKRLGISEGTIPSRPIFDLCYKSDALYDPLINDYQAVGLDLVKENELSIIYEYTHRINEILAPLFKSIGITLVDYKVEFGRLANGDLVLSDDISPDSARFWDIETGISLDKDRFRRDSGKVGTAYRTVYERLKAKIIKDQDV